MFYELNNTGFIPSIISVAIGALTGITVFIMINLNQKREEDK